MAINNGWIKMGALVAALAVVLGGIDWHHFIGVNAGQNSASETVTRELTQTAAAISKAVYFQLTHALAITLVGVLGVLRPSRFLRVTGCCFLIGIVLFCGSIYLSVFADYYWLEYVKLAGVLTLVGAWILLVEAACPGWNRQLPSSANSENSI